MIRFARDAVMSEAELRKLVNDHGFSIANLSCRMTEGGKLFEYRMMLRTLDRRNTETLSQHLRNLPQVIEFRISPTGD
jgi:putative Mg2+ transporter-C (MgtC) family protein